MDLELAVLNFLVEGLLVNDDLVSIKQMLLKLVGNNALKGIDLVCVANRLHDLSYFVVSMSRLDKSQSGLDRLISSENDLGFFASHWCSLIGLNNDGVANESSEAVDVDSQLNFNQISLFDGS